METEHNQFKHKVLNLLERNDKWGDSRVCSDLMLSDKARDSLELAFVNITCVYIYVSAYTVYIYIISLFH